MNFSVYDYFKNSLAWDERYNLPLIPIHNNPHIYCAYAYKIIKHYDKLDISKILPYYILYANNCELIKGLYYRWPDHSGGPISHDELMGMAYISSHHAKLILEYLRNNYGCYDNGESLEIKWRFFRFNLYRLPWFIVFLKACAGYKLNFFDKLVFSTFLKIDAYNYKGGDEGGRLRIWLMLEHMTPIIPDATRTWRKAMLDKNCHLVDCFSIYFKDIPEFAKHSSIF